MTMMEVGAVIDDRGEAMHWHLPPNRSSVALPDSRKLWDVLWEHRHTLAGVAHSHPGSGVPEPSYEDVTTFAALEAALGRRLRWWITSTDHIVELQWKGPKPHEYERWEVQAEGFPRNWLNELRRLSYENNNER